MEAKVMVKNVQGAALIVTARFEGVEFLENPTLCDQIIIIVRDIL